jgi:hypothetical protein
MHAAKCTFLPHARRLARSPLVLRSLVPAVPVVPRRIHTRVTRLRRTAQSACRRVTPGPCCCFCHSPSRPPSRINLAAAAAADTPYEESLPLSRHNTCSHPRAHTHDTRAAPARGGYHGGKGRRGGTGLTPRLLEPAVTLYCLGLTSRPSRWTPNRGLTNTGSRHQTAGVPAQAQDTPR